MRSEGWGLEFGINEPQEALHQPHDTSYRFLLSSKKLFVELLRSFVDKGWVDAVDEAKVQTVPRSFILPDFQQKEADIVYQVNVNGQDVLFYLLLELQSSVDFLMPYRLLLYQVEIWRYWMQQQEKKLTAQKMFRLPLIVPIVLYNGEGPWTVSRRFREKVAREDMFGPELIDFEYILIDVARYREEDLLAVANTIGSVFLLDQTRDKEELQGRLNKLLGIMRQMPEENQQKFFAWIVHMLARKWPEGRQQIETYIRSIREGGATMGLEQTLDAIERKGEEKGLQKGLETGIEKGIETVAKRMIAMGLDTVAICDATGFSAEKINQLREQVE